MLKILVTGGNGMLGNELKNHIPKASYMLGKNDLDLSNLNLVDNILPYDYDIIIHTAAYTNISYSENFPQKAFNLHAGVIPFLQSRCKKLIYISAQGKNYNQVYFKTKLKGEKLTLKRETDLVIRTNIYGNGGLVNWALKELNKGSKINGYTDVIFNPLSTLQLSKIIVESFQESGIINTGTKSIISKYDFLKILALKNNLDVNLIFPTKNNKYQDLTVDLKDKYREFNLIDGILKL
jgi:dTDP-4-dehydrorhamnose reductase